MLALLLEEIKPKCAVLIGDRQTDIQAGKDNNLYTIAVTYGYGTSIEFDGADLVVSNTDELREILLLFLEKNGFS